MADLRSRLLLWFDRHRRDLPWRRTRDPYAIWVSEVMLQQTQVSTVIPFWERFLERFPNVGTLARAPLPEVLSMWRGLGYYSRARNLHRAAQEIEARHGGNLPADLRALLALPGFGRYTAGAVASMAFGQAAPVVDGNVARVLSRLFEIDGPPGDKRREEAIWSQAQTLVEGFRPGDLNQALMELGALVCRPEPTCLVCPARDACQALRKGRVDALPPARVRPARKPLRVTAALWRRRGKVLLARRSGGGLFGGLWELPTIEESGLGADAREQQLAALLGVRLALGERLAGVRRTLTHRDLTVEVFAASGRGEPRARGPYAELGWFSILEAEKLGMSTAMAKALFAAVTVLKPTRGAARRIPLP